MAGATLILGFLVIVFVAIHLSVEYGDQLASFFTVLGLFAVIAGLIVVNSKQYSGRPKNEIAPGVHKVAFIYRAGEYVSVGIEEKISNSAAPEDLVLYQFPSKEFVDKVSEGVNPNSGKLRLRHFKITDDGGTHDVYELVPKQSK